MSAIMEDNVCSDVIYLLYITLYTLIRVNKFIEYIRPIYKMMDAYTPKFYATHSLCRI